MFQLPENLETIEDEAFAGCESLKGPLVLPHKMQSMGKAVFSGTHLGEEETAEGTSNE